LHVTREPKPVVSTGSFGMQCLERKITVFFRAWEMLHLCSCERYVCQWSRERKVLYKTTIAETKWNPIDFIWIFLEIYSV